MLDFIFSWIQTKTIQKCTVHILVKFETQLPFLIREMRLIFCFPPLKFKSFAILIFNTFLKTSLFLSIFLLSSQQRHCQVSLINCPFKNRIFERLPINKNCPADLLLPTVVSSHVELKNRYKMLFLKNTNVLFCLTARRQNFEKTLFNE